MLGVSFELRTVTTRVPDNDDAPALIAMAEVQIEELRDEQETVLDDLEDAEREMTMAGMPLAEDTATARLRKDEARARKELSRIREARPQEISRPDPRMTRDRSPLSNAAIDNLVARSRHTIPLPEVVIAKDEQTDLVIPTTVPADRPRTRQARKELERRARAASRTR